MSSAKWCDKNRIFFTIALSVLGANSASANVLDDKQSELDLSQAKLNDLQNTINAMELDRVEAVRVDQEIQKFTDYHDAFMADFSKATQRYHQLISEQASAQAQDQKEIDAVSAKLTSAYQAISSPGTTVPQARFLALRVTADVTNTQVCRSPRSSTKAMEIASFVWSNLSQPSATFRATVNAFDPPIYLIKLKQDSLLSAAKFESAAKSAAKTATQLTASGNISTLCEKVAVLTTLVGVKSIIDDIKRDSDELNTFDVAKVMAGIKRKEDVANQSAMLRRFLLGLDTSFNARIAANHISAAQNIADHASDTIDASIRDAKSNTLFEQDDRDALLKLAEATRADILATAKASLGDISALQRMLLLRTSNLYNEVRITNQSISSSNLLRWQDFKSRFEQTLLIKLTKPFNLPSLTTPQAMFAYDKLVELFETEVKTYEAGQ